MHDTAFFLAPDVQPVVMQVIAENLSCERGGRLVLNGVNLAVASGQLLELTGPNGSGKSTLLKVLAGLIPPAQGRVSLEGGDADRTLGEQSHYVSHADAFKPALTVRENLGFWRDFLGGGDVGSALAAVNLTRTADFPAGFLSAGQRRRLALARLALAPRSVWLLDEPNVGIDAASQQQLQLLMQQHLAAQGIIIAATHIPLGIASATRLELGASA